MKQMGLDPKEFMMSTYDDPELAELDREMKRRGEWLAPVSLTLNRISRNGTQRHG